MLDAISETSVPSDLRMFPRWEFPDWNNQVDALAVGDNMSVEEAQSLASHAITDSLDLCKMFPEFVRPHASSKSYDRRSLWRE